MKNKILYTLGVVGLLTSGQSLAGIDITDQISLRGLLMADYESFGGIHNDDVDTDEISVRRAKLKLYYRPTDDFRTKLQIAYDEKNEKLELNELTLRYSGFKFSDLTVGKMKEPFGLEYSTSSRHLMTMERSLVSEAIAPNRHTGFRFSKNKKRLSWALGAYEIGEWEDDDNIFAFTGRLSYAPIVDDEQILHLGFSSSWREGSAKEYRIKQTAGVYSGEEILKGPKILADTIFNYGVEGLWIKGPFSLQAEAYTQDITVEPLSEIADTSYFGYYMMASYTLTGEMRRYKKGKVSSVSAKKNRVWELVARVESLDALTATEGSKADNWTLGLNYYFNNKARVMLNYTNSSMEWADELEDDDGQAVTLRAQLFY